MDLATLEVLRGIRRELESQTKSIKAYVTVELLRERYLMTADYYEQSELRHKILNYIDDCLGLSYKSNEEG